MTEHDPRWMPPAQSPYWWSSLLAEFEAKGQSAARLRHEAALAEIARAEAVQARIATLVTEEKVSMSQADRVAHAEPAHRAAQRQVARLSYEADAADRLARALECQLRWAIAGRFATAGIGSAKDAVAPAIAALREAFE
jgi:hypothetical protein